jgi:hypothetical protein
MPMQKSIAALAVTLITSTSMLASAGTAEAHRRHYRADAIGAGIAAAVIGGIVLHSVRHRHHRRYYDNDYNYTGFSGGNYRRHYYDRGYSYGGYGGYGGYNHRGYNQGSFNTYYTR